MLIYNLGVSSNFLSKKRERFVFLNVCWNIIPKFCWYLGCPQPSPPPPTATNRNSCCVVPGRQASVQSAGNDAVHKIISVQSTVSTA